jgi:hypothetical protein
MSLSKLIALQKQATKTPEPAKSVKPAPVESESSAEESTDSTVPAATPPMRKGLGLNVVGTAGFKKPTAPAPTKTPASAKPKTQTESLGGEFSLEDLAGLDASSIEVETRNQEASGFEDEIEATAPDRDLPPDLTAEQLSFVESLDGVYQVLHDPELFGQAVRLVMLELQENNEYEKLLADSDIHIMIRGMRRTMGLARVRKQEKGRKGATNKNARAKAGVGDKEMALLNSLMGGGDDD